MKTYYVECSVAYTDNSEPKPFNGVEMYSYTVESTSKKLAESYAKQKAERDFNEEINNGYANIYISINQIYETISSARCY